MGGHGDVIGCVIACSKGYAQKLRPICAITGGILHPLVAYLLHRGLTMPPLRVRAQQENAQRVAEWMQQLVEPLLAAAGRRFTLSADHAVAVPRGVHERALTITAIAGPDAPEGLRELGWRLAELLFVIIEPLPA